MEVIQLFVYHLPHVMKLSKLIIIQKVFVLNALMEAMILHVIIIVQNLTLDAEILIVQQHYYSVIMMDVKRAIIMGMIQINVHNAFQIVLNVMTLLLAMNVKIQLIFLLILQIQIFHVNLKDFV